MKRLATTILLFCCIISQAQELLKFNCQVVATGQKPSDALVADLDNDGKVEIIVGNLESSTISILSMQSTGDIQVVKTLSLSDEPWQIALSDINKDGYCDIIGKTPSIAYILINKGALDFEEHRKDMGTTYNIFDFELQPQPASTILSDGYIPQPYTDDMTREEFSASNIHSVVRLIAMDPLTNNPTVIKEWHQTHLGQEPRDYNNDGFMDFIRCQSDSGIILMLQDAAGNFNPQPLMKDYFGSNLIIEDNNKDNLYDVVLKDQHSNKMHYYESKGSPMSFTESKINLSCDMRDMVPALLVKNEKPFIIGRCYEYGDSRLVILRYDENKKTFIEHQFLLCEEHPSEITIADVNGDGKNDIIAVNFTRHNVSIYVQE